MRKRFESQLELGAIPVPEVWIDKKSRHELPQLLAGLQYIFITDSLHKEVFEILEKAILANKKLTGRLGMSLWEILVLGVVRLTLDIDYDSLQDQANNHRTVRGMLGVDTKVAFGKGRYYELQTIKDNVGLLDEQTLKAISEVVVKAGHQLKKNESGGAKDLVLNIKSDSYAVESTIHFPTDINLLWDSARKCLDIIELAAKKVNLKGWRKIKVWTRHMNRLYRKTADIHHRKGRDYKERLVKSTQSYLILGYKLSKRLKESLEVLRQGEDTTSFKLWQSLQYYHSMLEKHLDLLERRIIKGEKIPHEEKVFSIFENHVEWIQKGKHNNKVELGHNVLVSTDQYHFILDHRVMINEVDSAQPIALLERLKKGYSKGYTIESLSFDRGFYTALGKAALEKEVPHVVMPKKGKASKAQKEQEAQKSFQAFRNSHSAVESNINELENSGVNRVPDKGLPHFKQYVAMGVLAYNLKRLGRIVISINQLNTLSHGGQCQKAA